MEFGKTAALVATLLAAGVCASGSTADDPPSPPVSHCCPMPTPFVTPLPAHVPEPPQDRGQQFHVHSWRSDRIGGVVREQVRFTLCSSLTSGPFRVAVTESKGWSGGEPKFVQGGRFNLRFDRRYPIDVPQCRQVSYSWRPKGVMLAPGARAMDITITYPTSAWPASPKWPLELSDHEVTIR
jgi:hypothetical protein